MRLFRSRILAFLMLATALTFSTGMGLVQHTCLMKDETTVSLTEKKGCCTEKKDCPHNTKASQTAVKKPVCCADETLYIQVDFAGFGQNLTHLLGDACTALSQVFYNFVRAFADPGKTAFHYTNSSPPLSGRDRLAAHCTYLI